MIEKIIFASVIIGASIYLWHDRLVRKDTDEFINILIAGKVHYHAGPHFDDKYIVPSVEPFEDEVDNEELFIKYCQTHIKDFDKYKNVILKNGQTISSIIHHSMEDTFMLFILVETICSILKLIDLNQEVWYAALDDISPYFDCIAE